MSIVEGVVIAPDHLSSILLSKRLYTYKAAPKQPQFSLTSASDGAWIRNLRALGIVLCGGHPTPDVRALSLDGSGIANLLGVTLRGVFLNRARAGQGPPVCESRIVAAGRDLDEPPSLSVLQYATMGQCLHGVMRQERSVSTQTKSARGNMLRQRLGANIEECVCEGAALADSASGRFYEVMGTIGRGSIGNVCRECRFGLCGMRLQRGCQQVVNIKKRVGRMRSRQSRPRVCPKRWSTSS